MPALPQVTTDFIARIKSSLNLGSDLNNPGGSNIHGAAQNYLRAQDMSSVFELLQDALSNVAATGVLTIAGVPSGTFILGDITYTWAASPSAAFEVEPGASAADAVTNLVAAINLTGTEDVEYGAGTTAHPLVIAADGTGDTVDMTATNAPGTSGNSIVFDATSMTNGTTSAATLLGGSDGIPLTASNPGTVRTFQDGVAATGTVTFTGVPTANDTLDVGDITYTWVASPTVAFDVDIGADADGCVTNLVAAINLSGTEGVEYGTGTTIHPDVTAVDGAGSTVDITAIATGVAGNTIVFTESMDNTTISGSGTLAGGVAAFVANAHAGDIFTFDAATTTTELQDLSFTIASNTDGVLTFTTAGPVASVVGDIGLLVSAAMNGAINELREGGGLADAPRGDIYGDTRTVADALSILTQKMGATQPERQLSRPGLVALAGIAFEPLLPNRPFDALNLVRLNMQGTTMRVDEFRGAKVVIDSGEPRIIVRNDETTVTLNINLSALLTGGESVVITVASNQAHKTYGKLSIHPGAQPGENIFLAELISQAEAAVVAFVLPV